jgi:protein TonB
VTGGEGLSYDMLLHTRYVPVREVIRTSSAYDRSTGQRNTRPPTPKASTIRYYGIPQTAGALWLAIIISAGLHTVFLLGFNGHAPVRKIAVVTEPIGQMLMMPDLKDDEEKPKELNDEEQDSAPAISVPMLADIITQVPLNASFIQQLDPTVPLKSDPMAGRLVAIPVNIQHGRPDESGIKNLFNVSELDHVPEPIVQTRPDFPYELKRAGIDGRVRVGFIVDSHGEVILPYVVSSTNHGFERAAIEAVKKWKFRPGIKNGRKVNTRVEQPIDFKVTADEGG